MEIEEFENDEEKESAERTSLDEQEGEEFHPGTPFQRTDPQQILKETAIEYITISRDDSENPAKPRLTAADFGDADILDTLDVNEPDYEQRKAEPTI